ncbi:MAG: AI-2E family transporter [Negativicutes bacterium]|jgi:predicted PurR-regulated permease PerM
MNTAQIFIGLKILIVIAFLALIHAVSSIWLPLTISLVLTFGMLPIVRRFERIPLTKKKKMPKTAAIILTFILVFGVLAGLAVYIITPLTLQLSSLITELPQYANKAEALFGGIYSEYQNIALPDFIREKAVASLSDVANIAVNFAGSTVKFLLSLTSSIVTLVLVPFLTYYFLKDGDNTVDFVVRLFPRAARVKTAQVMTELGAVMTDYIKGQIFVSLIIGFMVTVGTWSIGLQYSLIFGLLATLLETIPYIGPICAAVPALALGYLVSPLLAVKVLIFYVIIHIIEANIVVPNVMGKTVDIHPGILMVALLIGGELYGIIGMMAAVPATAILRVVLRAIWFHGEEQI